MNASAAIVDSLLRRGFGGQARPSDLRRTARVCLRSSGLLVPVPPRDCAISLRIVIN